MAAKDNDRECCKCKIEFNGENIIGCEGDCRGWFHLKCVSISEKQYSVIKACVGLKWFYETCYSESEVKCDNINANYNELRSEIADIRNMLVQSNSNNTSSKGETLNNAKKSYANALKETLIIEARNANIEATTIQETIRKEIVPADLGIGVNSMRLIPKNKTMKYQNVSLLQKCHSVFLSGYLFLPRNARDLVVNTFRYHVAKQEKIVRSLAPRKDKQKNLSVLTFVSSKFDVEEYADDRKYNTTRKDVSGFNSKVAQM